MHKKILLLSFLAIFSVLTPTQLANAQEIAPQPCDPQFYRQMTSRAWLESEREIMQNQNLIFKADSVFDYVCFDRFLANTAFAGGDIFTHTEYFGGGDLIPRGGDYGLEVVLEDIVFTSLLNYRNANYEHSWLGGRGEHVGLPAFDPRWILPPANRGYADYTCDTMFRVWDTAKCLNFVHNAEFSDKDSFYPFEPILCAPGSAEAECTPVAGYTDLPGQDVRKYPAGMECNSESGALTWEQASIEAENRGEDLYRFQTPLGEIFLDVLDRTLPGNCRGRGQRGIQTGVTVVLSTGPAHQDGVCTNPGCTYTAGGTCVGG